MNFDQIKNTEEDIEVLLKHHAQLRSRIFLYSLKQIYNYQITPKDDIFYDSFAEMEKWLEENCKGFYEIPVFENPKQTWTYTTVFFMDEADALAFKLAWC